MPYTAATVPDNVPKKYAAQFAEVWNSAYKAAKADKKSDADAEASAFAQAHGVIKKAAAKDARDVSADGPGFGPTEKKNEDGGQVSDPQQSLRFTEDQLRDPSGKFASSAGENAHTTEEHLKAQSIHIGRAREAQQAGKAEEAKAHEHASALHSKAAAAHADDKESVGEHARVASKAANDMSGIRSVSQISETREKYMSIEKRYAAELRVGAPEAGDEMSLVGYAARFNTPSKDLGGFKETIAPGAFTRALADPNTDIRCLFNHSADRVLGRLSAGTLQLKQDDNGLWFRCQLDPNNTEHRNLHSSVKRGDINECSFAFTPNGPEGDHWEDRKDETGKYFISRTLKDVNLFDVSAVTNPAYNNTSVAARSEAVTPEIRSIMSEIVKKRATLIGGVEVRDISVQDVLNKLSQALYAQFPQTYAGGQNCSSGYGKYWMCDTYSDYVIASEDCPGPSNYVRISYVVKPDGDGFIFGTPTPVEKEWIPSERCTKADAEFRALTAAHMQAIADQHKAEEKARTEAAAAHTAAASEHTDAAAAHATAAATAQAEADRMAKCEASQGDCSVKGCRCQNQMVAARDMDDAFDFGDDDDWDYDVHTDEENAQHDEDKAERSLKAKTEMRAADAKVLTKTVAGKALPASAFALVGDPKDTSTWKLPVHDKAHADNAAARLNQVKDIPEAKKAAVEAKIASAQKKFGETDADKAARSLTEAAARAAEKEDLELRFRLAMSKPLL